MASFWLVSPSPASPRFLKPSFSLSRTLSAGASSSSSSSSYNPVITITSRSNAPNTNPYPNASLLLLLGPFSQRRRRWSPSCANFDLRRRAHVSRSSSSASTGAEKDDDEAAAKVAVEGSTWIDLYLPRQARPYAKLARLDKPIGTWLFAWPCMWSITLAATPGVHLPDIKMLTLFAFGALFVRGAACTINDLLDRDIDAMVERTKSRPLASGVLTPFQGLCFLGFQLLLGLGLLLQLNNYSRVLGAAWLLLIFTYPLMKRLTYWPQAYLGLMINWGCLLGWAAVKGTIDPAIMLPLYISGVFWTLVYVESWLKCRRIGVAHDKEDDVKVGVKSTALRFGDSTKKWLTGFGIMCITSLALAGYNAKIGWAYYASLGVASGHLAWQIWTADLSSPLDCNRKFVSNKWFGAIIFIGILLGRLLP